MGEDTEIAYGSYGSVEAQAAEEEIQVRADQSSDKDLYCYTVV